MYICMYTHICIYVYRLDIYEKLKQFILELVFLYRLQFFTVEIRDCAWQMYAL